MAYYDLVWYCNAGDQSTTGYYAVAKWAATTAIAAGALRRQLTAPAVGSERVFVAIVGGTTGSTEPTWVLTRGAKTTDNTVTWMEVTGMAAVNSDLTNTVNWTAAKAIGTPTLGAIIQRNNGASYWICTTAGTMGASEPAWPNDTAGTTQTDGTVTWTCLGVVGNFTGGQAPHARLNNVAGTNWFAAGNTVYVGDNHAESQTGAMNISFAGSNTIMSRILCHNHSGGYPPASGDLMSGASVAVATAFANLQISGNGALYLYGIAFKVMLGATSANSNLLLGTGTLTWFYFDNCSIQLAQTSGNGAIFIGNSGGNPGAIIFNNTTVKFGSALDLMIPCMCKFVWQNTGSILVAGSAVPATLFQPNNNAGAAMSDCILEALDLSQINTNLYSTTTNPSNCNIMVKDCKLNAAMTVTPPGMSGSFVQLVRSDSGATAYKSTRYQFEGTETTETSTTRVGGASDPTGQVQSRKIVTSPNSNWSRPFKAEPYAIWNPTTGATVTVTVYGIASAAVAGLPKNDDIWMDVEYLGSSSTPLGTIINTTKANLLAANAAVPSDSSTWNNSSNIAAPPIALNTPASTDMTLSNGNLTATRSANTVGSGAVGSLAYPQSSGQLYFEVTRGASHGASDGVGVLLTTGTYSDMGSGNNCLTIFTSFGPGSIYSNNGSRGSISGAPVVGDVIGVAVDLTNHLGWVRKNGGNWNGSGTANPATSTGGFALAAGSYTPAWVNTSSPSIGDTTTFNFGQTSYANAAPSGFGNWVTPPINYTTFKLVATLSGFTPANLAGLIGWWDASVTASLSLTGSNINSVADQSGNGQTMTSTGFAQPTYNATGYNSKPTILLGSGSALTTAASFPMGTGNTLTVWYVGTLCNNSGSDPNARIIDYISPAGAAGGGVDYTTDSSWAVYRPTTTTQQAAFIRNNVTAGSSTITAYPAPHRFICTVDPSGVMTIYVDGISVATATKSGNWASGGTAQIGRQQPGGGGGYWAGPIAEAGIATGYSDAATVAKLDTYLANKWGFGGAPLPPQPGMAGYIEARVRVGKPSSTFYLDPKIVLS